MREWLTAEDDAVWWGQRENLEERAVDGDGVPLLLGEPLEELARRNAETFNAWIFQLEALRWLLERKLPGEGGALADESAAADQLGGATTVLNPEPFDLPEEPGAWDDPRGWSDEDGYPKRPAYCGRWSVAGEVEDDSGKRLVVNRIDCGRWICPKCAPSRAKRMRIRLREIFEKECPRLGKPVRFWTFTLQPCVLKHCAGHPHEKKRLREAGELEYRNRCQCGLSGAEKREHLPGCQCKLGDQDPHRTLAKQWSRFRALVLKHVGKSLQYVSVVEHHKSGIPHLHVAVDRYIPWEAARRWWGLGHCFVLLLTADKAARYFVKYLAKECYAKGWRAEIKFRRLSASRGIVFNPRRTTETAWELIRQTVGRCVSFLRAHYRTKLKDWSARLDRRGFLRAVYTPLLIDPWELKHAVE